MRILIADDHAQITQVLKAYAEKEGFEAEVARDCVQVLGMVTANEYDILLLDVMMPGMDEFEVCRKIREKSAVPNILVTARGEDFERIMGLDIGADNYVVKPFSHGDVMARVRAVLRRTDHGTAGQGAQTLIRGSLTVDAQNAAVTVHGQKVELTRKETDLLLTLAQKPGRVFSREQLLQSLWG